MMTGNSSAAAAFKLKEPADYFANPKTVALVQAALGGDEARVRQLVAEGADPNEEGPMGKDNRLRPLHYAVAANNPRAVQLLVAAGANPELNAQGFGRAPLFAIVLDNMPMLSLLLDLRPPEKLSKDTLEYLMFRSVALPRPRAIAVLLQKGVPVDFPDEAGNTIFMEALAAQDFDLAEWILQQGAAVVRQPTAAGFTPANALQFQLGRMKPGSPSHAKLVQLQQQMQARGAVFPAPTPQEARAARGQK